MAFALPWLATQREGAPVERLIHRSWHTQTNDAIGTMVSTGATHGR